MSTSRSLVLLVLAGVPLAPVLAQEGAQPPISIRFKLAKAGEVTLVIEDAQGNRVRNLVAATAFPAGDNVVYWDGRDESVRVPHVEGNHVGIHGIYKAMGRPVQPGKYSVRGLVRDPIQLKYDLTVYPNVGTPPWRTADGLGAWLSDHNPAADTEFVPATPGLTEEPRVYMAAPVAEAGFGLIWTDLNGKKINGVRWIGGHWTGASYLARDAGAKPVADIILYTGSSFRNDKDKKTPEVRLNCMVGAGAREILKWVPPGAGADGGERSSITGLAARDGLLVATESSSGKALFVRVSPTPVRITTPRGTLLGTANLPGARDLAFDASGRLLVLTTQGVRRYNVPPDPKGEVDLGPGEAMVTGGLQDPQRMTLLPDNRIAITDWGTSHQVKVFGPGNKVASSIGVAGAPQVGPYNKNTMGWPMGLTTTPEGNLWVAEYNYAPKRVSVWSPDGKLVRDMIGPPPYGGGGWLDPTDKTKFYLYHGQRTQGGGMEFQVNWEAGKAELANVYQRSDPKSDFGTLFGGDGPDCPVYFNNQRFLTNAWSSNPTGGSRVLGLWSMKGDLAVPVMAAGNTQALPAEFVERLGDLLPVTARPHPKGGLPHMFLWSDGNGNGQMEKAEWKISALPSNLRSLAPTRSGDLALTLQTQVLNLPVRWAAGVPYYEPAAPVTLVKDFNLQVSSGGAQSVAGKDGWVVLTNGPVQGFLNGQQKWYYHNQWPGLHAGHRAPAQPDFKGQLVAVTRLLGPTVTPKTGEAGEIWGVNSDRAVMYLMTTDGLFVAQLGNIDPNKQWRAPEHERNLDISDVNFVGENFWPTLNQSQDGQIYLGSGKEHSSLIRVEGLESVRRIPAQPLDVTQALLVKAEEYERTVAAARAAAAVKKPLQVAMRTAETAVDGDLMEWKDAQWVVVDGPPGTGTKLQKVLPIVEAAIAVSGDNLVVALRSRYLNLLANQGQAPQELFKTGGGLDIMLRSNPAAGTGGTVQAGDKRLLLALAPGGKKMLAALFEPVVPGTKPEAKIPFSSPWRTITFDKVEDIAAKVKLARKTVSEKDAAGDVLRVEQIEASIPLSLLGITPRVGLTLRGDVGILRGQGSETTQRLYWSNKQTGLMSDVPGEAMLSPGSWGEWQFVDAP